MFLLVGTMNGKAATFLANTCLQFSDTILTGVLRNCLTLTGILRFFTGWRNHLSCDQHRHSWAICRYRASSCAQSSKHLWERKCFNLGKSEEQQHSGSTVQRFLNQVKSLSYIVDDASKLEDVRKCLQHCVGIMEKSAPTSTSSKT